MLTESPHTAPWTSGTTAVLSVIGVLLAGFLWILISLFVGYKEPKL